MENLNICICGGAMSICIDFVTRNIRGTDITLNDIRHDICERCGEIEFYLDDNVSERFAEAYKAIKD